MEDKVRINIQVGDVKHPLLVEAADEPIYREAARLVNERVARYATKYRGANLPRDFMMSFAAIDIAARYVRLNRQSAALADDGAAIEALTDEIRAFLATDGQQP